MRHSPRMSLFCRHDWTPWRRGMLQNIAEIVGLGDDAIEREREMFAGHGLPGAGISGETDDAMEHRTCSKCRKFELRARSG